MLFQTPNIPASSAPPIAERMITIEADRSRASKERKRTVTSWVFWTPNVTSSSATTRMGSKISQRITSPFRKPYGGAIVAYSGRRVIRNHVFAKRSARA